MSAETHMYSIESALTTWSKTYDNVVLCLHGISTHGSWFKGLASCLEHSGIGLAALTRRGSGDYRDVPGLGNPDLLLADIHHAAETLRERGTGRLHLLGWCWGALPALVAFPSLKADSLILAAPAFRPSVQVKERFRTALATKSQGKEIPLAFDPLHDFSTVGSITAMIAQDSRMWRSIPAAFVSAHETLADRAETILAHGVPHRTFVILGADDVMTDNQATRALFAGNRIDTIQGGHAFILEQPKLMANLVAAWISRASPSLTSQDTTNETPS